MLSPHRVLLILAVALTLSGLGLGSPHSSYAEVVDPPFLSLTEDFTTTANADLVNTTAVWDTIAGNAHLTPQAMSMSGSLAGTASEILVGGDRAFIRSATSIEIVDLHALTAPVSQGTIVADLLVEFTSMAWTGKYLVVGVTETVSLLPPVYNHGLFVFDVRDPSAPVVRGSEPLPSRTLDLESHGQLVAACYGPAGIGLIDISNPVFPAVVGSHATVGSAEDAVLWGKYLYVANDSNGLVSFDIADPAVPVLVSTQASLSPAVAIARDGNHLALARDASGVSLLSVRNPQSPQLLGSVATFAPARSVAIDGNWIYAGESDGGIEEIDITTPAAGVIRERHVTGGAGVQDLALNGSHLHAALGLSGLEILEVATPLPDDFFGGSQLRPVTRQTLSTRALTGDVSICGSLVFACDGELHILDVTDPRTPVPVSTYAGIGQDGILQVAVGPGVAFVGDLGRFHVLDVSVPSAPSVLATIIVGPLAELIVDLELSGSVLLVALDDAVRFYDVSDAATPTLTDTWLVPSLPARQVVDLSAEGGIAWVVIDPPEFWYHDFHNPNSVSTIASPTYISGTVADYTGNRLVAASTLLTSVQDVTDLTAPAEVDALFHGSAGNAEIISSGSEILISEVEGELEYFSTALPGSPLSRQSTYDPNPTPANRSGGIAASGDFVFRTHFDANQNPAGCALEVLQLRNRVVEDPNRRVASAAVDVYNQFTHYALRITPIGTGAADWYITTDASPWPAGNTGAYEPVIADGQWRSFPNLPTDFWNWGWAADLLVTSAPDPRIEQVQLDVLYVGASVVSAADVPDDEGGFVDLRWVQSGQEVLDLQDVADYLVLRSDPAIAVWDTIGVVPAQGLYEYQLTVPTLGDSITDPAASGLNVYTEFMVRTRLSGGQSYVAMNTAIVQSIDDLVPQPPSQLLVHYGPSGGNNSLIWDASPAPDLLRYRIYRGDTEDFEPSASTLADSTTDKSWVDPSESSPGVYYLITAVDDAWQESGSVGPEKVTDAVAVPTATLALLGNRPNPFNPSTRIYFSLPRAEEHVSLRVYDARGRLVRTLIEGFRPAGTQFVDFDGRDSTNRFVASGTYRYRLSTPSGRKTGTMVLLK